MKCIKSYRLVLLYGHSVSMGEVHISSLAGNIQLQPEPPPTPVFYFFLFFFTINMCCWLAGFPLSYHVMESLFNYNNQKIDHLSFSKTLLRNNGLGLDFTAVSCVSLELLLSMSPSPVFSLNRFFLTFNLTQPGHSQLCMDSWILHVH